MIDILAIKSATFLKNPILKNIFPLFRGFYQENVSLILGCIAWWD
jgi:uncharacterized membrane protein YagU involved in acid resistance|tara:strand:- start:35332 stop:35466 length:135 start_codon:yes stop_codon:yes gene_type:complete